MDKIELIKKMVIDDPNNASAWYLLGIEYLEQQSSSEALKAFSEALKNCDDELRTKIFEQLSTLSKREDSSKVIAFNVQTTNCETNEDISNDSEDNINEETKSYDNDSNNLIQLNVLSERKSSKNIKPNTQSPQTSFNDVGGLNDLKETIKMKIIKPFTNPGLFEKFKKKIGGGILLFGPPGCGKTFIAKATAGECQAKFIPVHITDILDPYLGMSEQNIKDIFSSARLNKPSILFFDEIDAISYNRARSSSEHMRPIVDQLLAEIEGIDSNTDKLLIFGATNMPWDVDPAFKRPGRFDKTIFVPPPDLLARENIFKLKLKDKPIENVNYNLLAKQTELYSGADIENVVEIATENVISDIMNSGIERQITMNDLQDAIHSTKPSTLEWLHTIKNYVKYANQSGLFNDVEKFLKQHNI